MVEAVKEHFRQVYSIELDESFAAENRSRFQEDQSVRILCGDSGMALPKLLRAEKRPAVFFLDAHYSGIGTSRGDKDTPILEELKAIFAAKAQVNGIVLIDDAHVYSGVGDWPHIDILREMAGARKFEIEQDIIRITP
jgi:hypothetical protein